MATYKFTLMRHDCFANVTCCAGESSFFWCMLGKQTTDSEVMYQFLTVVSFCIALMKVVHVESCISSSPRPKTTTTTVGTTMTLPTTTTTALSMVYIRQTKGTSILLIGTAIRGEKVYTWQILESGSPSSRGRRNWGLTLFSSLPPALGGRASTS